MPAAVFIATSSHYLLIFLARSVNKLYPDIKLAGSLELGTDFQSNRGVRGGLILDSGIVVIREHDRYLRESFTTVNESACNRGRFVQRLHQVSSPWLWVKP